jgi:hypothetical protein
MVTTVLAAALAVRVFAPASWQSLIAAHQHTDSSALTIVAIWANNLLICCLPLLAGVLAHRLVERGRQGWGWIVLAFAAFGVGRSVLVIGLVGGLDPSWLLSAAAWWILEVTGLGACCAAGWHAFRTPERVSALRQLAHGLAFTSAVLAVAAVVEVART